MTEEALSLEARMYPELHAAEQAKAAATEKVDKASPPDRTGELFFCVVNLGLRQHSLTLG